MEMLFSVLGLLILVGVVIMIKDIVSLLIDKDFEKNKVKQIRNELDDFAKKSNANILCYETKISVLCDTVSKIEKETADYIRQNDKEVSDICEMAVQMAQVNALFYKKIELLSEALKKEDNAKEISKFIDIVKKDIVSLERHQKDIERQVQERDEMIRRRIERSEPDMELER